MKRRNAHRLFSLALALALCLGLLPAPALAAGEVSYLFYTGPGQFETRLKPQAACNDSFTPSPWAAGWYYLSNSHTITGDLTVNGEVNLILGDGGHTLTITGAILLDNTDSLTIYAQSEGQGAGSLVAQKGIRVPANTALTIHGGQISAGTLFSATDAGCAGIGGGNGEPGGTVTIYGGTVNAYGSGSAAGIGGGLRGDGGDVNIHGGTVTATGLFGGAGIGGGSGRDGGGTVNISGGKVTANGGDGSAGIGGGFSGDGGIVNISGGAVTATGGVDGGAGIGGGDKRSGGTVNISGGTVTATGSDGGAGIGGGSIGDGGTVNIHGGIVTANGRGYAAGIGGGMGGTGGDVTVDGDALVFAACGSAGAAHIGPGYLGSGGTKTLTKGVVFEGAAGRVYGSPSLPADLKIPSGSALTVPDAAELTVPDGKYLNNFGSLTVEDGGTLTLEGYFSNDTTATATVSRGGVLTGSGNFSNSSKLRIAGKLDNTVKTTIGGGTVTYGLTLDSATLTLENAPVWVPVGDLPAKPLASDETATLKADPGHTLPAQIALKWADGTEVDPASYSYDPATGKITLPSGFQFKMNSSYQGLVLAAEGVPAAGDADNNGFHDGDEAAFLRLAAAHPESAALSAVNPRDPAGWETAGLVVWDAAVTPQRIISLTLGSTGLKGSLDASGLTALDLLGCNDNELTALDLSTTKASRVSIGNNPFTSLTLGGGETLTVTPATGGTVWTTAASGINSLELTAKPDSGYRFERWTRLPDGVNASSDTVAFNLSGNATVEARFTPAGSTSGGGDDGDDTPSPTEQAVDRVENAKPGDTVNVDLPGSGKLPGKVLEAAAGKDITLEIDAGDGLTWIISGKDIPKGKLADLNLKIDAKADTIPVTVMNALTGEKKVMQLALSHDGPFGFPLTLRLETGKENAGMFANLYYYNETAEALEYQSTAKIGGDGNADLPFSHASSYAVVIDEKSHAPVTVAFSDIAGHWAEEDILYVASHGLLNGTGGGAFSPDATMTRGMFVTALHRLAGAPPAAGEGGAFTDVPADAYYADAVRWAASMGIVNGTTLTTFSPNAPVTREQMAVILRNYAQALGHTLPQSREAAVFSDQTTISPWAADAVSAMQMAGVLNGKNSNRFDPQGAATRAEVSAVLRRFAEAVIDRAAAVG